MAIRSGIAYPLMKDALRKRLWHMVQPLLHAELNSEQPAMEVVLYSESHDPDLLTYALVHDTAIAVYTHTPERLPCFLEHLVTAIYLAETNPTHNELVKVTLRKLWRTDTLHMLYACLYYQPEGDAFAKLMADPNALPKPH